VIFECDPEKEQANLAKHGVDFSTVPAVFADPHHLMTEDITHSTGSERRFYAIGWDGRGILTVRFTLRGGVLRVIGAGYWRKQKSHYEKHQKT
jgi:uncharacterized DUF497 family protein